MAALATTVHQLFIIDRSGNLIYGKELTPTAIPSGSNSAIYLAGQLFSLIEMASLASPVTGYRSVEQVESDNFVIHVMRTLTGLTILLLTSPGATGITVLLQQCYELYSDYVMKNPFYTPDKGEAVKAKCPEFDKQITELVETYNATAAG